MKVAREIDTNDFTVHDWLGDHNGKPSLTGLGNPTYTTTGSIGWINM
jgi:hypothetical protein